MKLLIKPLIFFVGLYPIVLFAQTDLTQSKIAQSEKATQTSPDSQANTIEGKEQQPELPPEPSVYVKKVKASLSDTYRRVFTALENNGYFVVFEPNIGKNLSHFAQRWGKDYNKNKLEGIRSMVFCNAWYANAVSNTDPEMLALCPLHITLIHKQGVTQILFVRPSQVAAASPAREIVTELEQDVVKVIERSLWR